MWKFLFLVSAVIVYVDSKPSPQDLVSGALMLAGQVKDVFDNGAAARDETEIDVLGVKFKGKMELGFGDALSGRRRRSVAGDRSDSNSVSDSEENESAADYDNEDKDDDYDSDSDDSSWEETEK